MSLRQTIRPVIPWVMPLSGVTLAAVFLYAWGLPDHVTSWDATQLALALEHLDFEHHQPHPPGYLGHLGLSALMGLLGFSSDQAVLLASLVAAVLSVAATFFLGFVVGGPRVGALSAGLYALHPLAAFYAVSGETYPLAAFTAAGLGILCVVWSKGAGSWSRAAVLGLFLGFASLVRQDLTLFLFPMAALTVWRMGGGVFRVRVFAAYLLGLCAGLGLAHAPYLFLGIAPLDLLALFRGQFFQLYGRAFSPLLGASSSAVLQNTELLGRFTLLFLNAGGGVGIPCWFASSRKGMRQGPGVLLWVWMVPTFAWFLSMYVAKPGHLLFMLPALCVLSAEGLVRALGRGIRSMVSFALPVVHLALFLSPPIWWITLVGDTCLARVRYTDARVAATIALVRRRSSPLDTAVVCRDGGFTFRNAAYYLQDYDVYWLLDSESTGAPMHGVEVCKSRHYRVSCDQSRGFWMFGSLPRRARVSLAPSIHKLLFFVDERTGFFSELRKQPGLGVLVAEGKWPVYSLDLADGGRYPSFLRYDFVVASRSDSEPRSSGTTIPSAMHRRYWTTCGHWSGNVYQ